MSEELIKKESNLPQLGAEDYGYDQEISSEGLQLPIIKLCQNATRERPEGCKPGDFYNAATGKVYGKSIAFNVFKSFRGRIKFAQNYKLECKSSDGKTGTNIMGARVECSSCPYSNWKDTPDARRTQYCPPVVTFLALLENEFIPSLIGLSKVREKAANKINSQLKYLIMENRGLSVDQQVPIYFYKVQLSSVSTEYNSNTIYDVAVKMLGKEVDSARQGILIQLFRDWKAFESNTRAVEASAEAPVEETAF
jgi:hypothetical protein